MLESPNSASAISAALRIAWPAAPALPLADSGKIRPTLKSPVPSLVSCSGDCAAGAAVTFADRFDVVLQPASHVAPTTAATIAIGCHHGLAATLPGKRVRVGRGWTGRASDRLRAKAIQMNLRGGIEIR